MIFALPLYDDNPIRRMPVVTYVLIGMCIGAFLWQLGQNEDIVAYQFGMIPAVLFGYAELPHALQIIPPWATIFTSMFLHGGFLHLGGNMLFLWIFGNNIEDLLGRVRYLLLYLGSGVAAALAQALGSCSAYGLSASCSAGLKAGCARRAWRSGRMSGDLSAASCCICCCGRDGSCCCSRRRLRSSRRPRRPRSAGAARFMAAACRIPGAAIAARPQDRGVSRSLSRRARSEPANSARETARNPGQR